jgi:hypothetical protein
MLYVEHPIGTGYSVGRPTATNETDISRDLFGFFIQWLQVGDSHSESCIFSLQSLTEENGNLLGFSGDVRQELLA